MTEGPEQSPATPAAAPPSGPTWITPLAGMICIGIFIGLLVQNDYESEEALARFGLFAADRIWDGAYWGLFTPAFIHFEIWHLALNLYWLWRLGSMMERRIGYLPYLAFYLVSAFVASSAQLAGSSSTGIGASGVVYAIFGFMWVCRKHFPEFGELVDDRIVKGFLVWAVACVVLTRFNLFQVANAAHFAGLVFGGAVGGCVVRLRGRRIAMIAAVAALIAASVLPLFWSPWSVAWLSHRAYQTHMEGQYEAALAYYTRVLALDDANAWAYHNRSLAQLELGNRAEAEADLRKAKSLDPTIKDSQ